MEKELKSCTGVLLRDDLTGHSQFSQSADFCQKGWDGLLCQPSKGCPCRISILFLYCSTTFKAPQIKQLETCYISELLHSVWEWIFAQKYVLYFDEPYEIQWKDLLSVDHCYQKNHHWCLSITCIRALLCKYTSNFLSLSFSTGFSTTFSYFEHSFPKEFRHQVW